MNKQFTFTPKELLVGLLLLLAVVAFVFLIILLIKLISAIGRVNKLLASNEENIEKTLHDLPVITENTSITLANVRGITDVANDVVSDVGELVDSFVTPSGPAGILASVAGAVVSVVQVVREFSGK